MRVDLLGKRFGRLVAIEPPERGDRRSHWVCLCDCGNKVRVCRDNLLSGGTRSCGCLLKETSITQMEIGSKYGSLTILGPAETPPKGRGQWWQCRCDCGNIVTAHGGEIRRGIKTSCKECGKERLRARSKTHGMTDSRLYKEWANVKARCNGSGDQHNRYHARGITYCSEWERFEPFMEWALANGYDDGLELDRIDNNGNYEPSNCRWTTRKQQNRNKSTNLFVELDGQKMCFADAARMSGINEITARHRYVDLGWSAERTFHTPVRKHRRHASNEGDD